MEENEKLTTKDVTTCSLEIKPTCHSSIKEYDVVLVFLSLNTSKPKDNEQSNDLLAAALG